MSRMLRELLPFGSLILIICLLSVWQPDSFLTVDNFLNVLRRSSVYGVIAVGMTFVIIAGGIDLSVGSLLALSGMVAAQVMVASGGELPAAQSLWLGVAAGLGVGLFGGLLNGLVLVRLKLQPFIVTLGTMSLFRGVALVMNDGQPINVGAFRYLAEGTVLGLPVSILLFVGVILVAAGALRYTRFGRHTYAIGSNAEAAYHAGVNVRRAQVGIYALVGALTGLAGLIATSRTVSAQPTAGVGAELDVIAAVVIGGASLSGGRGTITGTIIGTLLISFLRNGCTLVGISTNAQLIVIGVVIIIAVALDQFTRARAAQAPSSPSR
jgi:ribose/xylose/arabinose/galactoside ABC-type transport system permease subunit